MNKKVLIISPYFPPSNTADMQRIRTSLPYFEAFGWEATVVVVDEKHSDTVKDGLLALSIPSSITIHKVKALNKKLTGKLGLGSMALRSLPYYRKKVNHFLETEKFDLIYFSTTQFMITVLGAYWKKRFGIPYVIDMQDPWYSIHYKQKPKNQRPSKYYLAYALHKYLEPIAIKNADGLISVSADYIQDLKDRYPVIAQTPNATITFGAFEPDNEIATAHEGNFISLLKPEFINVVYIGRGGTDMHKALTPVFEALKKGMIKEPDLFNKLKFYFIGTSYAPSGAGIFTILPLARQYGVESNIIEITDRVSYYHTMLTLQQADALLIIGAEDPKYTASKIYPYLLTKKPLVAIFNEQSNSVAVLNECAANTLLLTFGQHTEGLAGPLYTQFIDWANGRFKPIVLLPGFENYSAKNLTGKQIDLFNQALKHFEAKGTNH